MRTNEERMNLIFSRAEEIQKEQQKRKQRWIEVGCVAVCMVLIIALGIGMPGIMGHAVSGSVTHNSGAASLIASQSQLGYIVVGIFSFALGCITTIYYIVSKNAEKIRRSESYEF